MLATKPAQGLSMAGVPNYVTVMNDALHRGAWVRVVLILCTWLLGIQTTQLSYHLCYTIHNQGEVAWMNSDWDIRVATWGLEL